MAPQSFEEAPAEDGCGCVVSRTVDGNSIVKLFNDYGKEANVRFARLGGQVVGIVVTRTSLVLVPGTAQYVEDKSPRSEGFGLEVKRRIMLGFFVSSSGYYDAYYLKALRTKALIKKAFDKAFGKYDVILSGGTLPLRNWENL